MVAMNRAKDKLDMAKIVIIKVGSALLVDEQQSRINGEWLAGMAADIANLHAAGKSVVVVSSGAIALGQQGLGLPSTGLRLEEKQAAAATGQVILANAWMMACLLYTSPSPRDRQKSRMPSSA